MANRKRILLTGATGFVGRQILNALNGQNAWVRATTRRLEKSLPVNDQIVTTDLFREDAGWWQLALADIDIVIHAAWYVEPGKYLESKINAKCLRGSLALADAVITSGARHFVGIGTCFEYDTSFGILDIHTPLAPQHRYSRAKAALFNAMDQVIPIAGKTFAWHRLFYLYGEGEKPGRLVSNLHRHMQAGIAIDLTSGTHLRDFLDVSLAGAMIAHAALDEIEGPYNICSGTGRTVRQIAEEIADLYGRRDLLRFGIRAENPFDPPEIVGIPGNNRSPDN